VLVAVVGCRYRLLAMAGTSMVTWMAAFGMVMAIQALQKK